MGDINDKRFKHYYWLRNFLEEDEFKSINFSSILSQDENFESIFNNEIDDNSYINENDNKRKNFYLTDEWQVLNQFTSIVKKIKLFCEEEYPFLVCSKISLIKSYAGCLEQQPHTDYDVSNENAINDAKQSLFCLLSLMDETKIILWTGCHNTIHKEVNIPKGSLFIGRGTLIHSGASYMKENIRLHFYLRAKNIMDISVDTFLIKLDFSSFHRKCTENIQKYNEGSKTNRSELKRKMSELSKLRWNKYS